MRRIASRMILSLEPFVWVGVLILFWFPSNFPAKSTETSGIITAEWAWIVMGLLPLWMAFWINQTTSWKALSRHVRWILGGAGLFVYLVIYPHMPFLPTPSYAIDRADWFWLLAIFPLFILLRWAVYGRGWVFSWVDVFAFGLILLCVVNIAVAPSITGYAIRGEGWVGLGMLFRPLLGILLMGYCITTAQRQGMMDGLLQGVLVLTAILTLVALAGTQWTTKSTIFVDIIRSLDVLPNSPPFFRRNSINPNEIAGMFAWLIPLCGVCLFYPWKQDKAMWRVINAGVVIASLIALILGQSRFAIVGILGGFAIALVLLLPTARLRLMAIVLLLLGGVLQVGILLNAFSDDAELGLSARDERSTDQRLSIWSSGLRMFQDYPLTGVGLNNFRVAVRSDYPIEGYERLNPPHAHNELLQIATDLGIWGVVIFVGLHGALVCYLWQGYRHGERPNQIMAVGVGTGILAHAVYGIGDAIPLWDRASFLFWLMLGFGLASSIGTKGRQGTNAR